MLCSGAKLIFWSKCRKYFSKNLLIALVKYAPPRCALSVSDTMYCRCAACGYAGCAWPAPLSAAVEQKRSTPIMAWSAWRYSASLVEAAGVEPASKQGTRELSTCLAGRLVLLSEHGRRQPNPDPSLCVSCDNRGAYRTIS